MSITTKKRIVIKVGSALIAPDNNGCSSHYLLGIAQFIIHSRLKGQDIVLVSSGSVAAGRQWFDVKKPSVALKKAMAAAGQTEMIAVWDKLFDFPSAQVLLTHGDLCDRERYMSIKETISSLLEHGVLPIINENDTVTSEELKVGDNDNLAAMVAAATDADALIMCTDVNGLYNKNPQQHEDAVLIENVKQITEQTYQMAGSAISSTGTGGMRTKIEAAEKAIAHGIDTYIINGFNPQSFTQLMSGKNPGTHFSSSVSPMTPAVHWMTHTSKEAGEVIIDDDNTNLNTDSGVVTSDNIVEIIGDFSAGDTILLRKDDGTRIAKARANYSSCLLNYITQEPTKTKEQKQHRAQNNSIIATENLAVLENL
jgi:glutamate 5-kinase